MTARSFLPMHFDNITFSNVNGLLKKGIREELTVDDIGPIEAQDNCNENANLFWGLYNGNLQITLLKMFGKRFGIIGFGYFAEIAFKIAAGWLLGMTKMVPKRR